MVFDDFLNSNLGVLIQWDPLWGLVIISFILISFHTASCSFNKSKIIKSYLLLKIIYGSDRFIVAMGSKNINKFTKDQQVDLIEYLIQVIQIRLADLN